MITVLPRSNISYEKALHLNRDNVRYSYGLVKGIYNIVIDGFLLIGYEFVLGISFWCMCLLSDLSIGYEFCIGI